MREPFSHELVSIVGHASSLNARPLLSDLALNAMRYWITQPSSPGDRLMAVVGRRTQARGVPVPLGDEATCS